MRRALIASFLSFAIAMGVFIGHLYAQDVYDWHDSIEEAYFYSLFNTSALLDSGFGRELEGQDELIARFIAESGFTSENEPVVTPLLLPFNSGRPQYAQSESRKWVGDPRDGLIRTKDISRMITAYAVQAKQLERLYQTGIDQTSETRLNALIRGLIASEAISFAHTQMRDPVADLYFSSESADDESFNISEQLTMLWALSEITTLTDGYAFYRGSVSRFESELWADDLFEAIETHSDENPEWLNNMTPDVRALFVQAVSAYGAIVSSASHLETAVDWVHAHSAALIEQLAESEYSVPVTSRAIRALINAKWMTGDESFQTAAIDLWESMQARWNERLCIFDLATGDDDPNYEYSADQVADIVAAFGALIYGAGMDELKGQFAAFFDKTVKFSRLMYSETDEAGGSFDNDAVPSPARAGGPFGVAPVFATKVLFDPNSNDPSEGTWHITNSNFETGPAMYLATQLMWIGQRERQPYVGPPRYGIPISREAQFIGLQKQIEQLRSNQAEDEDVDGIRTLLQNLENQVSGLSNQISGNDDSASIRAIETQLATISTRLDSLEQEVDSVRNSQQTASANQAASNDSSSSSAPLTMNETVTILVIFLIILIGFVTYQWVVQRAKTD